MECKNSKYLFIKNCLSECPAEYYGVGSEATGRYCKAAEYVWRNLPQVLNVLVRTALGALAAETGDPKAGDAVTDAQRKRAEQMGAWKIAINAGYIQKKGTHARESKVGPGVGIGPMPTLEVGTYTETVTLSEGEEKIFFTKKSDGSVWYSWPKPNTDGKEVVWFMWTRDGAHNHWWEWRELDEKDRPKSDPLPYFSKIPGNSDMRWKLSGDGHWLWQKKAFGRFRKHWRDVREEDVEEFNEWSARNKTFAKELLLFQVGTWRVDPYNFRSCQKGYALQGRGALGGMVYGKNLQNGWVGVINKDELSFSTQFKYIEQCPLSSLRELSFLDVLKYIKIQGSYHLKPEDIQL